MKPYPDTYDDTEEAIGWRDRLRVASYGFRETLTELGHALLVLVSPRHWLEMARRWWYWWGLPTTAEEWQPSRFLSDWQARRAEHQEELAAERAAMDAEPHRFSPAAIGSVLVAVGFGAWLVAAVSTRPDARIPREARAGLPSAPVRLETGERGAARRADLGQRLLESSRFAEAAREFTASLNRDPQNLTARLGMAKLAVRANESENAAALAEEVIKQRPGDPEALNTLAVAQSELGKWKDAEANFRKALEAKPSDSAILMNAAASRLLARDWRNADMYAQRASAAAPGEAAPQVMLALIQFEQKRLDPGVAALEEAVRRQPQHPLAHHLLARARMVQRRWPDALTHLRQVQTLQPDAPAAFLDEGQVALEMRNPDEAEAAFRRALRANRSSTSAWLGLAGVSEQKGNRAGAIEAYEKALETQPNLPTAQNNLAFHYATANTNLERALQLARSAVAVQPLNSAAWDTLGWVSFQKGLYDDSVRQLKEAIRLQPKEGAYHLRLARALLALERRDEGVRSLKAAVATGLSAQDAGEAQQLLRSHGG